MGEWDRESRPNPNSRVGGPGAPAQAATGVVRRAGSGRGGACAVPCTSPQPDLVDVPHVRLRVQASAIIAQCDWEAGGGAAYGPGWECGVLHWP